MDSQKVLQLLHSLVGCFTEVTRKSELQRKQLLDYVLRIIASRITPSLVTDANTLAVQVQKKLPNSHQTFHELWGRLQKKRTLKNKWCMLYILYEIGQAPETFKGFDPQSFTPVLLPPLENQHGWKTSLPAPTERLNIEQKNCMHFCACLGRACVCVCV